jgi:hypothetical protein
MRRVANVRTAVMFACGSVLWLGGCPVRTGDSQSTELTGTEQDGVAAAAKASESLAQAINTAKNTAETGENQSACHVPTPTSSQELTFGSCPEVTMAVAQEEPNFSVTLDFGDDGCNPGGLSELTCAGSATGTYDQQAGTLAVSFDGVNCNDTSLDGDIDVSFDIDGYTVSLDGDWDLTYVEGDDTVLTDGGGEGSYDATTKVTTISSFEGTVSDGTNSWNATLSNIQISYATYENLIPFAGEATISDSGGRTITVRFDADSPATGVVEVSVNGSPFFEVDLSDL